MRGVLLVLFLCIPLCSNAAVIISEVAWMGGTASANHEWIELQNTGASSVDVSGWTLTDGMNLNISLLGTIPATSYAVLERTSDVSAEGTAFFIYTGALVNTGATLTLKRADGSIEDQVAGGENWQSVGGDNTTKETAQYTTSGWVTGTPTPGQVNSGTMSDPNDDEEIDEDTTSEEEGSVLETPKVTKSQSGETVRLILTDAMLALKIDAQKVGYVNQPITFEALPTGVGKVIENSLVYQWNFGDGGIAFGSKPTRTFSYPGTYIVTVYGAFKRQEQLARHEITILPVALSITKNIYGDVQVNNDSPYEIDISKYRVRGEKTFQFPAYSILLPNQTVTLAKEKVGDGFVRVFDAEGSVVAHSGGANDSLESFAPPSISKTLTSSSAEFSSSESLPLVLAPSMFENLALVEPVLAAESKAVEVGTSTTPTNPFRATTSTNHIPQTAWPYLGLIVVILLGLAGTATKISRNQTD